MSSTSSGTVSGAPTIVVYGGVNAAQAEQIRQAAAGMAVHFPATTEELARILPEADVVAGSIPRSLFGLARRVRWLHSWAAGVDGALYPELVESPIVMTCSKGNGAVPLAEHAMMLMLMLARDMLQTMEDQRAHRWNHRPHLELNGATLGIIGLGNCGQDLALKAKAFHMRVLGYRRRPLPCPNVDQVFAHERLHEFLGQCDYVVVTAALTPETQGMLGEAEFRAMKPTAYYVNVSRGAIAQPEALLRALNEGWIAGAGLDAHAHEPLPPESPFWSARNTIITPHYGATTAQTRQRGVDIFLENLRRFTSGQELINIVDKRAGY
jgi:phosphoglycerate dehydrogenase-like enzyme